MSTASSKAAPARQIAFGPLMLTVFKQQLARTALSRKTLILSIVMLLPVVGAIAYLAGGQESGLTLYKSMVEYVVIGFLLPMVALFYGGPAVVEEIEGRTIVYLFLRPVAKPAIFLGKYLAGVVMVAALVLLPVCLLYVIALSAGGSPADHAQLFSQTLVSIAVGCFSYTAVFAALGALFARSLLAGIIYWGVVEWGLSFVPALGLSNQKYHLRNAGSLIDLGNFGFLDKMVLDKPIEVPISASYAFLILLTVAALAVGSYVFNNRQYHV